MHNRITPNVKQGENEMNKSIVKKIGKWSMAIAASCAAVAWSANAQAVGPGTLCTLTIDATGEVLSIVTNGTVRYDLAVLVPRNLTTTVPVACADLGRIGVAVANQEVSAVDVTLHIKDHNGEEICTRGPFSIDAGGARGFVTSCPPE